MFQAGRAEVKLSKFRKANIMDCRFSIRNLFYEIVLHQLVTYSEWGRVQPVFPAERKHKELSMKLNYAVKFVIFFSAKKMWKEAD